MANERVAISIRYTEIELLILNVYSYLPTYLPTYKK